MSETTQPSPKPRYHQPSSNAPKRATARQDNADPQQNGGATGAHTPDADASRLLATHVPNLDTLLGGGIVQGSLAFISGPPGSGKTTLAAQIAFGAARDGRRVVILTALSEPSNKLITHLQSYSFFDSSLIGDAIQVISLQSFLDQGLDTPEDEIVRLTRQSRASVVILDGFQGIAAAESTAQGIRQFLYSLGAKLNILGATALITSETDAHDSAYFPEQTIADIIIALTYSLDGVRPRRGIEIVKSRGIEQLSGLHALQFTRDGLITYPRLEASVMSSRRRNANPTAVADGTHEDTTIEHELREFNAPLATFAMPALDELVGGGLKRGTSTLVLGSPGTGKTLLGLSFVVAGVRVGEPAVFVSFRENRAQLHLKAEPFNLADDLRGAARSEGSSAAVTVLRWAPVELDPDVVAFHLFATLDRVGARRLVIDGLSELENAITDEGDPRRVRSYTAALLEALRSRSVTSLFIKETSALGEIGGMRVDVANDASAVLAENMLLLRQVVYQGAMRRVLGVLKMRFSAFDASLREFTISPPEGIVPRSPLDSDQQLLSVASSQSAGAYGPPARRATPDESID